MDESDSEIYLAPSDILAIPSGRSHSSPNDNHVMTSAINNDLNNPQQQQQQQQQKRTTDNFDTNASKVLLEAVYHKGTWFAVDRKRLEECQVLEKSGKLSEVRISKLELSDLREDLKLHLVENFQSVSNDCSEFSDDEQFFTRADRGGYGHLAVMNNFESDIQNRIEEATLVSSRSRHEEEKEDNDDDDEEDDDSSSSEGDWSGEGCNSSVGGRSASSDEDEECLLKD